MMPNDLGGHFRAIWNRRYQVLAASLLIAAAVYVLSAQREDRFSASVRLRLAPGEVGSGERISETEVAFLATTYAELASARTVLASAAQELGMGVDELDSRTDVDTTGTPGFIEIASSGGTPEEAEDIAGGVSVALIDAVANRQEDALQDSIQPIQDELTRITSQLATISEDDPVRSVLESRYSVLLEALTVRELRAVDQLEQVSPARADAEPVSPRPRRDALLAFLVAIVLNSELAVLLGALGDRFSREDLAGDITQTAGVPLLARVPKGNETEVVEAFRELRTNLQFMAGSRGIATVAVVGSDPGVGKTMTALNLARSVASAGLSVVIVDGDLRRPRLHERLGISRAPGVTDFLRDGRDDVVRRAPISEPEGLHVMTSGSPLVDPSDMLASRFRPLIDSLRQSELTIVDTPPIHLFSDGLAIASQCDVTIVVIDVRSTKRRTLKRSVDRLQQVGANVVGVVANRTANTSGATSYYDTAAVEVARNASSGRGAAREPVAEQDPASRA